MAKQTPKQQAGGLPKDILEYFNEQWNFYKKESALWFKAFCWSMGLWVLTLPILYVLAWKQVPPPQLLATDAQGRITKLQPLSTPVHTVAKVRQWMTDNLPDLLSFNSLDMDRRLDAARPLFDNQGYNLYRTWLEKIGLYQQLKEKQLIVNTTVGCSFLDPKRSGVVNNVFYWTFMVEVTTIISDGVKNKTDTRMLDVRIRRLDSLESAELIGFDRWSDAVSVATCPR